MLNIGNSGPALLDYVDAIERALGREAERHYLPIQPGDVQATFADTSLLTEWTGFSSGTSVRDGVRRFVDRYSSAHAERFQQTTHPSDQP